MVGVFPHLHVIAAVVTMETNVLPVVEHVIIVRGGAILLQFAATGIRIPDKCSGHKKPEKTELTVSG